MRPLKTLVFNCGSSSLKFELLELSRQVDFERTTIALGHYEDLGHPQCQRVLKTAGGQELRQKLSITDHQGAALDALQWLRSVLRRVDVDVVAHRVVHGGEKIKDATLADDDTIRALREASKFAPLHNPAALATLEAVRQELPNAIPVVVPDTAFHHTIPIHARLYAIPRRVSEKYGIRRFGFHGIGHAYMLERTATLMKKPKEELNLITMQLGGGCSVTAIAAGRSVDTSMGLTPLEGLMMGTRAGDVDPGLLLYLASEGMTVQEIDRMLNHESGLLGLSNVSDDIREVLAAASRDPLGAAAQAIEAFAYRARKYLGA